jgi:hypothetical protein
MCDPVSIAMGALSVGSAFMQNRAASEAADAQNEAAQVQYADNMAALREQQLQINQSSSDQQSIRALEALRERGRLNAASGEMGVTGNSIDKALQESLFNEGTDISTIESNRKNSVTQNQRNMSGVGVQRAGNINQANSGRISGLATGLQAGLGVAGAYNMAGQRAANKAASTNPNKGR